MPTVVLNGEEPQSTSTFLCTLSLYKFMILTFTPINSIYIPSFPSVYIGCQYKTEPVTAKYQNAVYLGPQKGFVDTNLHLTNSVPHKFL